MIQRARIPRFLAPAVSAGAPPAIAGLLMIAMTGCEGTPAATVDAPAASPVADVSGKTGWMQVMPFDQGLGMPTGSLQIPADWRHQADIATDPMTGLPQRYRMELRGPEGETLIALGTELYVGMTGGSLDQALDMQLRSGLGNEFARLTRGQLRASDDLAQSAGFRRTAEKGRNMGYQVEALEAPVQATRNGAPVSGRLYATHFRQITPQGPMGMASASVVIAPPERLAQALEVNLRVAESARPNPEYERRVEAIGAAYRQQQNAQFQANLRQQNERFQANLRQRQAAFEANQQAVRERSAIQDRSHQQYMDTLRGSGSPASGSGYT